MNASAEQNGKRELSPATAETNRLGGVKMQVIESRVVQGLDKNKPPVLQVVRRSQWEVF